MNETIRQQLIQQLRAALHQVESPLTEVAEFEILDTEFSIDFTEDENILPRGDFGDLLR